MKTCNCIILNTVLHDKVTQGKEDRVWQERRREEGGTWGGRERSDREKKESEERNVPGQCIAAKWLRRRVKE